MDVESDLPSAHFCRAIFTGCSCRRVASNAARLLVSYSWLPGTGLNRIMRKAIPWGEVAAASTIIAIQMMFNEVAAIATVPWLTAPVFRNALKENRLVGCVDFVLVSR